MTIPILTGSFSNYLSEYQLIQCLLMVFSGFLATIQTIFNYGKKSQAHFNYESLYSQLGINPIRRSDRLQVILRTKPRKRQDSKLRFSDKRQFLSETSCKLIENPYYQRTQKVRWKKLQKRPKTATFKNPPTCLDEHHDNLVINDSFYLKPAAN